MVRSEASASTRRPDVSSMTNEAQRLKLLIVSEIRFLREALAELLGRNSTAAVLGLCADLDEAIAGSLTQQPDIVLFDAGFRDGPTAVRRLLEAAPERRVVVLAVAETTENIIAWAEAGAAGYVPQTTALADLVGLLVSISRGGQVCSAQIVSGLLRHVARTARADHAISIPGPAAALTKREREIGVLIGAGLSNKEIARRLDIGLATTKSHVHNLLSKMNVQRRSQATVLLGTSGSSLAGPR
jgi:two-component system, NarL family, nitrate/nitrite response regulator NarL